MNDTRWIASVTVGFVLSALSGCQTESADGESEPPTTEQESDQTEDSNEDTNPDTDTDADTISDANNDTETEALCPDPIEVDTSDGEDGEVLSETPGGCDGPLRFVDPNLEHAVRTAICMESGDIYYEHVKNLTKLKARLVEDLSGIRCLTGLKSLDLDDHYWIEDISQLSKLTHLTELDLTPFCIEVDEKAFSSSGGGQTIPCLGYCGEGIVDLTPLSGLTELTVLSLPDTITGDILPLAGLTALTDLDLSCDNVTDVSALADLTALTNLNLSHNHAGDISPLSGLTALTHLDLSVWNMVDDISPLSGLTALVDLNISNNRSVGDLLPLRGLTALTRLDLTNNIISDVGPLLENSGLGNGDTVRLGMNNLDCNDAQTIADLAALEERGVYLVNDCQ